MLQPEVTFIEGVSQMEMVDTDAGARSSAISPTSSRPQGSRVLSDIQRRNLLVTPPRGPIFRLPVEQTEKETEEYESMHDKPANSADKSSVTIVRVGDI